MWNIYFYQSTLQIFWSSILCHVKNSLPMDERMINNAQGDQKFCFFFCNMSLNFSIVCRFSCQTAKNWFSVFITFLCFLKQKLCKCFCIWKHVCGVDDFQVHTECYQYLCKRQTRTFIFPSFRSLLVIHIVWYSLIMVLH